MRKIHYHATAGGSTPQAPPAPVDSAGAALTVGSVVNVPCKVVSVGAHGFGMHGQAPVAMVALQSTIAAPGRTQGSELFIAAAQTVKVS